MLTSTPGTCGRWAHSPQNSPSDSPLRAHRGLLGPRHTRRGEQRGLKNEPVRLRTERQESKGVEGKARQSRLFLKQTEFMQRGGRTCLVTWEGRRCLPGVRRGDGSLQPTAKRPPWPRPQARRPWAARTHREAPGPLMYGLELPRSEVPQSFLCPAPTSWPPAGLVAAP